MTADASPDELAALAARLAPDLVGLTREEAERRVAVADERLTIRFAGPDEAVTLEFRYGRITALLADGVVDRASAG